MAGNLHNGYVYPQNVNTTRAKAVLSGGKKQSPTGFGTIGRARKNTASAPKNKTPISKGHVSAPSVNPKQVNSVSKNVGNAHSRGFGR